jgi:hypothetical protein
LDCRPVRRRTGIDQAYQEPILRLTQFQPHRWRCSKLDCF